MKFVKTILILLVITTGLLFLLLRGTPTINDRYLEQLSGQSTFQAFKDSLTECTIRLVPEVLDRLIIEVNFGHLGKGKEYLKNMDIEIYADKKEQSRIFDISIHKLRKPDTTIDEIRVNSFDELPSNSPYRDFSYTFQPQFKLDTKSQFDLKFRVDLADSLRKIDREIVATFHIENKKEVKLERIFER